MRGAQGSLVLANARPQLLHLRRRACGSACGGSVLEPAMTQRLACTGLYFCSPRCRNFRLTDARLSVTAGQFQSLRHLPLGPLCRTELLL